MSDKLTGMHVSATERMTNSVNGNPRYRVIASDREGTVRILVTQSDASCSYDVDNVVSEHRRDPGATVTLGLTRAGRISTITREPRCTCDDSDVYDGHAECGAHPG